MVAFVGDRPILSLEDFLEIPTEEEWQREIDVHGWTGPDGSSSSTDDIEGIRIGVTSPSYEFATLPANLHDWRYQLARRLRLPAPWRRAADAGYRDGCLACVAILIGFSGRVARRRARARYWILRAAGWRAWRTRDSLPRWIWGGILGALGQ
jgi:hypothetical protein